MRVEEIPGSATLGTEPAAAVVCWNPLCTPPDDQVGTWYRGRPAWPWHEWEWLADRLIIAEPTRNRSLLTETPTSFYLAPIVHSGRSGIDQSVRIEPPKIATLDGVRDKDRYPPQSA